jgi:hypothetical protein
MCNYDCYGGRGRQNNIQISWFGVHPMNESLSLSQALTGVGTEASLGHAGGAATIMKCRGTRPAKNEIEMKVLMTLRGPVVCQIFSLSALVFMY